MARGARRTDIERHFSSSLTIVWSAAEGKIPHKLPLI
jgi:hypothetical protein